MLEDIVTILKRLELLEGRMNRFNNVITITDDYIMIKKGKSEIVLFEDGRLQITAYSENKKELLTLTIEDIISLFEEAS